MRKSIQIAPGIRVNFSKSGIGYSAGVKGYRVTKQADGRVRRTTSVPGTGLSYVTTSGSARRTTSARPRSRTAARPRATAAPRPIKPGAFAPKGEKDLFRAVQNRDVDLMERVVQEHPDFAVPAAALAGLLELGSDDDRARVLFRWVFDGGGEPGSHPFVRKYVHAQFHLQIAPGAVAEVGLDRTAVGLALAELCQSAGDVDEAIRVVEQLEPTTLTAVSLSDLYLEDGRFEEVVELTDGIVNDDDLTALLCVFRGVSLREGGHPEAARAAFREALKSRKRQPVIRHRALLERARTYEAEGKRTMARKDLERIMAEDSSYEGLADAFTELGTE